jgi:multiple sugar transport system substrate-binding protein
MFPALIPGRAAAQPKKLRILRWKNFVPGFETWFNDTFIREWGEKNSTDVIVSNVGLGEITRIAEAEAKAKQGHDLVLFLASRAALEDHVIDHREIFEECRNRYGDPYEFIRKSCYNPKTKKYHGFCESYSPTVLTYRKDLWDSVGQLPDSWDNIRKSGRAIKLLQEKPVGISLAMEHNSEHSLRAMLYAFGGAVQDQQGNPALSSKETLEALKFCRALYEEAMTADVLTWDPPSNNRFMLSETGSLTLDTMSIIRAAENKELPVNEHLSIAALPAGPAGNIGPMFSANSYLIWQFSSNIEGAKKFLVDYIGRFEEGFRASGFQNMPGFPGCVPNLDSHFSSESASTDRYEVLKDVPSTLTNLGNPGYSNAATDEVRRLGIISTMFAHTATGRITPEDAMDQAGKSIAPIFDKWREAGKI